MKPRGKLYVLEGIDGAGKSALCAEVVTALGRNGAKVHLFSFPGKQERTLGELVYKIHHNKEDFNLESITSTGLQALHIAAHLDIIESSIIPLLSSNEVVLLDRFWWSTWVYGILGGANLLALNLLIRAEKAVWGRWRPSAIIYLTRGNRQTPLSRLYEQLVIRESRVGNVHTVTNNTSIDKTVLKLLKIIHV